MSAAADIRLGRRAIEAGLLTPDQLQTALMDLAKSGARDGSLGAWLLERKLATREQLDALEAPSTEGPSLAFGKYRLVRELGRGGVGVVYEAVDTLLQRKVALKMLQKPREVRTTEDGEDRFLREARLTARLPKHPHVVSVYEVGEIDGRRFFAMEFIEGREWHEWAEGRALRDQVASLRKIALALHHAHEHGVVHRDLKPANVLVGADGEPHVTDFGLAKPAEPGSSRGLTREGFAVGTPGYMSPEQIAGEAVDRRTDVFALGVLLYELLGGRRPFDGKSDVEILASVLKDAPEPPTRSLRDDVDPARAAPLEALCLRALAKQAAERPPTAQAFADALGRWLEEGAGPATRRELRGAPRRSRLLPAAAGALGLLLVLAAAVALRPAKPALAPTPPPAPPPPAALLRGAVGEYYADPAHKRLAFRRLDPWISFRWKEETPELRLPRDGFSVRWKGVLRVTGSGPCAFQTLSDDGVRLWIDGALRIENWSPHPPAWDTATLSLDAGEHRVELDYYEHQAGAEVELIWKPPGADTFRPVELWHRPGDFEPHPAPAVPGLLHEGEWLRPVEPPPGKTVAQRLIEGGRIRGKWSADTQLFWTGGKPGDRLRLEFLAPAAGPRTLALAMTRSTDFAVVRLSVNGRVIAESLDLYDPEVVHGGEQVYPGVELRAGVNVLQVELVGSNPKARPWQAGSALHQFGLDYLAIRD
jgi:serine/threonine protein kinase